jgi:hypothetical protein
MQTRLLRGPLLLFLYQAVPVTVTPDSLDRHRLTVGFGGGRWENERFSCDGDLLSALPVSYSSGGVQYDVWATPSPCVTTSASRASRPSTRIGSSPLDRTT